MLEKIMCLPRREKSESQSDEVFIQQKRICSKWPHFEPILCNLRIQTLFLWNSAQFEKGVSGLDFEEGFWVLVLYSWQHVFFSLWFWEWFHHPKAMVIFEAFGRFGWENICPKKIWAEIFFGQGQRGHENLEPILKVTKRKKTWKFTFGQIREKTLDKKETHGNCYYYVTHFLTEPWLWKGWLSGWVISDRLNQFPAAHPARIFWTDPSKSPGHHAKLAVPTLGNSTWNSLEQSLSCDKK